MERSARFLYLLLFCLLAGCSDKSTKPKSQQPFDQLQGEWVMAHAELRGQKVPPEDKEFYRGHKLFLDGHSFTLVSPERKAMGTFLLDDSSAPMKLDLRYDEGGTRRAIAEFRDRKLYLCWGGMGGDRPTEFSTDPNSPAMFLILEKAR